MFALCVVVTLLTTEAAWGLDDAMPLQPRAKEAAAVNSSLSKEYVAQEEKINPIQSITFKKDMELRDALYFLAARYQKNIVPSAKVDGTITVTNLYDVTFESALSAVLGHNFKWELDGNFIRIYTADEYKSIKEDKSRMISKVYTLYYTSAAEASKLISPVLSTAGQVKASSPAEIGVSTDDDGVTDEGGGDSLALNDAVVVYDYPENIEKITNIIKQIDIQPQQVLIEATILSATLTEGLEFGIDLNFQQGISVAGTDASAGVIDPVTGGYLTNPVGQQTVMEQISSGTERGSAVETTGFATLGTGMRIGVSGGNMSALITALETVTDITVLANPKILALNKQTGTVFIGQKLGYRDRTTISSSGDATVGEVKFLDTGTKLSFRPYIGNDGYIRMDIYPKDSSGELDDEGIPTETTAELNTNIMVKDGETIVIGGLFRDAIVTTRSQVPILGDLPLIGAAFRSTNDSSKRQEVIVLLTPHIITHPSQTMGDARAQDISRKRYGATENLQWIGRARLAEDRYEEAAKLYIEGKYQEALKKLDIALKLRPTYLEAIRLRDRIAAGIDPSAEPEYAVIEKVKDLDTRNWLRQ
jgi:type II secretory pathway component GspD/PulD (secretin)